MPKVDPQSIEPEDELDMGGVGEKLTSLVNLLEQRMVIGPRIGPVRFVVRAESDDYEVVVRRL